MDIQKLDLRKILIKSDLEHYFTEYFCKEISFLSEEENKILTSYHADDLLFCIREVLINIDLLSDTQEVFASVKRQILLDYPDLEYSLNELEQSFYMNIRTQKVNIYHFFDERAHNQIKI